MLSVAFSPPDYSRPEPDVGHAPVFASRRPVSASHKHPGAESVHCEFFRFAVGICSLVPSPSHERWILPVHTDASSRRRASPTWPESQRLSNGGAGNPIPPKLHLMDFPDQETLFLADFLQQIEASLPPMSERKIRPHIDFLEPEPLPQYLDGEVART